MISSIMLFESFRDRHFLVITMLLLTPEGTPIGERTASDLPRYGSHIASTLGTSSREPLS
jgi:hypothetical protein